MVRKLLKDWIDLLKDDDFQQDLIFLVILIIIRSVRIIGPDTFQTLAGLVIAGDAIKKLGKQ